jgi:flagellar biogenesis protein FliO
MWSGNRQRYMDVVQPLAAIVLVMALLGGVLLILKKRGAASATVPHWLEVVERVSLGPQHELHLVRAGERVLLVVTGPNSSQFLDYSASGEERA